MMIILKNIIFSFFLLMVSRCTLKVWQPVVPPPSWNPDSPGSLPTWTPRGLPPAQENLGGKGVSYMVRVPAAEHVTPPQNADSSAKYTRTKCYADRMLRFRGPDFPAGTLGATACTDPDLAGCWESSCTDRCEVDGRIAPRECKHTKAGLR